MPWAAEHGRVRAINQAISAGVDVVDSHLISLPSEHGHESVIKRLVEVMVTRSWLRGTSRVCSVSSGEAGHRQNRLHQGDIWLSWTCFSRCMVSSRQRRQLYLSSERGQVDTMKLLLDNLDSEISLGYLPSDLQVASERGFADVVLLLLQRGDNVMKTAVEGWTVLHCAAENGHSAVVELLVRWAAVVDVVYDPSWLPLGMWTDAKDDGSNHEDPEAVFEFWDGSQVVYVGGGGWVPLHLVISRGHIDVVRLLPDNFADCFMANEAGWGLLHMAAANGPVYLAMTILNHDLDQLAINSKGRSGSTPLLLAVSVGKADIVKLLISRDADTNARDSSGKSPLCYAISRGYVEIDLALLEKGADISLRDQNGDTPLFRAIWARSEMVQLRLGFVPNVNAANLNGNSPLHFASVASNMAIINMLLEHC